MDISETKETVRLMQGIAQQGSLHLRELNSDFAQVRELLSLSVDRICASFMRIAQLAAVDATEPLAERPAELSANEPLESAQRLAAIAMIAAQVTTELQFHDLTTQILHRSNGRVNGLDSLLTQLSDLCIHLEFEDSEGHRARGISLASDQMMNASVELANRLRKTVAQTNLDVGDVELF